MTVELEKWCLEFVKSRKLEKQEDYNIYEYVFPEWDEIKLQITPIEQLNLMMYIFENDNYNIIYQSDEIKHQLTHQSIYAVFTHIALEKTKSTWLKKNCFQVKIDDLKKFAMPQLLVRYLAILESEKNPQSNSVTKKKAKKNSGPLFY